MSCAHTAQNFAATNLKFQLFLSLKRSRYSKRDRILLSNSLLIMHNMQVSSEGTSSRNLGKIWEKWRCFRQASAWSHTEGSRYSRPHGSQTNNNRWIFGGFELVLWMWIMGALDNELSRCAMYSASLQPITSTYTQQGLSRRWKLVYTRAVFYQWLLTFIYDKVGHSRISASSCRRL